MGVTFSPDSSRFYAAGGENGMIWVGDTASAKVIGSVNLNGSAHPFGAPMNPATNPSGRFKGTFPGNLTLGGPNGRYLYVVEQGSFNVFVVDTTRISTGVNASGFITEPNNFAAVVGHAKAGRYPYGIAASADGKLFVANVGIFQYAHLTPRNLTGDSNTDYPLGYPGTTWPNDMENDKTIRIKKVDPRNLAPTLRDPAGIRVGYIDQDIDYTIPGLGSPNVQESSSIYVFDLAAPTAPALMTGTKTGPLVGEVEHGKNARLRCRHAQVVKAPLQQLVRHPVDLGDEHPRALHVGQLHCEMHGPVDQQVHREVSSLRRVTKPA
jgi:hypothetical protein